MPSDHPGKALLRQMAQAVYDYLQQNPVEGDMQKAHNAMMEAARQIAAGSAVETFIHYGPEALLSILVFGAMIMSESGELIAPDESPSPAELKTLAELWESGEDE